MVKEVNLNKTLYKTQLWLLKVIPMVMAFMCLLNTVLSYFYIDMPILSYIGSTSILGLIFLYTASYTFKFCAYHRMFLHYILVTWVINIIDTYIEIPIGDLPYLLLQLIVAGTSLFIILYLYVKTNKKSVTSNSGQNRFRKQQYVRRGSFEGNPILECCN